MSQLVRSRYMRARRDFFKEREKAAEVKKQLEYQPPFETAESVPVETSPRIPCENCGKDFSPKGISNHKRACKA